MNIVRKYGYVLAGSDEKIVLEIERELNLKKNEIIESEENIYLNKNLFYDTM